MRSRLVRVGVAAACMGAVALGARPSLGAALAAEGYSYVGGVVCSDAAIKGCESIAVLRRVGDSNAIFVKIGDKLRLPSSELAVVTAVHRDELILRANGSILTLARDPFAAAAVISVPLKRRETLSGGEASSTAAGYEGGVEPELDASDLAEREDWQRQNGVQSVLSQ